MDPESVHRLRQEQREAAWAALSDIAAAMYDLKLSLRSDSDWRSDNAAEAILRIAQDVNKHIQDWKGTP